jgi:hypothetical protein
MRRDEVIALLKEHSDAYLSELQRGEVPAEAVWGVLMNSLQAGFSRLMEGQEMIQQLGPNVDPESMLSSEHWVEFWTSVLQVATVGELMLECLPSPPHGASTFVALGGGRGGTPKSEVN